MTIANPHVLIEMTDEADCRFVATWLTKAAEAQTFWSDTLNDADFALLRADGIPDLAAGALEILGELEHCKGVAALPLYPEPGDLFDLEFGLLVQLGFFVGLGGIYRLGIPEDVTLAAVKQAALDVLSTAEDEGDGVEVLQPERLIQTMPKEEAERARSVMMAMREFSTITTQQIESRRAALEAAIAVGVGKDTGW